MQFLRAVWLLDFAPGLLPSFWGPSSSPELLHQHVEQLRGKKKTGAGRGPRPLAAARQSPSQWSERPGCLWHAARASSVLRVLFLPVRVISCLRLLLSPLPQSSSQSASACEGSRCFLISDIASQLLFFTLSPLTQQNHSGLFECVCVWGGDRDKTDSVEGCVSLKVFTPKKL